MQPVQDLFLLGRGQGFQVLAPAGRYQEEDAPHVRSQVEYRLQHPWQLMDVASGDGGVDLHAKADFTNGARSVQRGIKDSLDTPECVMAFGGGSVQGQRAALAPASRSSTRTGRVRRSVTEGDRAMLSPI